LRGTQCYGSLGSVFFKDIGSRLLLNLDIRSLVVIIEVVFHMLVKVGLSLVLLLRVLFFGLHGLSSYLDGLVLNIQVA
jgi:hypothetical protein